MRKQHVALFLALLLCLSLPCPALAWHEEILNGFYSYHGKDLSIEFTWTDEGISKVTINSHDYTALKLDNLFARGDQAYYEIRITPTQNELRVLRLLFLISSDEKVLLVTGYYAHLELTGTPEYKVKSSRAILLARKPPPAEKSGRRVATPL